MQTQQEYTIWPKLGRKGQTCIVFLFTSENEHKVKTCSEYQNWCTFDGYGKRTIIIEKNYNVFTIDILL